MNSLARSLETARSKVQVEWTADRARRVGRSLVKRQKRRTRARTATGVLASLVLALGGASVWQRMYRAPDAVAASGPLAVPLGDGMQAVRRDASSQVRVKSSAPGLVVAELSRGGARFRVVHNPARRFRVEAGTVSIEDLGTQFTVERLDDGVRVAVEEGQVQVRWPGGIGTLSAGEQDRFPPAPENLAPPSVPDDAVAPLSPTPHHRHRKASTTASGWKALAEDGDYDAAYDVLQRTGETVRDETAELFLAVDVARLSHHPGEAVAPLKQILAHHSLDPRAPLAAFTLGRVLLEDLGSPRDAAGAFSQVRRLDPESPLVEDALAREVECWSRAGELQRAHARAEEYLRVYPDGRRARSVSRFGRVE
jgi:transmembrane sensor